MKRDLLTEEQDQQIIEEIEAEINAAAAEAEAIPPSRPDEFFDWIAASLSPRLEEQRQDLLRYVDQKSHP
jgi:TPP-dependent pyruvate/acetoin dehydrogenase alpha subunit